MLKVRCPGCQTKYQLPDTARGKKVKCKSCGQAFRLPAPKPKPDEDVIPFAAGELDALAGGETLAVEPADASGAHPLMAELAPPPTLDYAESDAAPASFAGDLRGYFASLGRTMAFPFRGGELATFIILWIILCIGEVVGSFGACFALIGWLIVQGWYMSYKLSIVEGGAAGEDSLPDLALTGGIVDDIIVPLFKMMMTHVVAIAPCLVFIVVSGVSLAQLGNVAPNNLLGAAAGSSLIGFLALLALGYFLWPMFVLVVAIGGIPSLVRFDLMLKTVVQSFPAYLLTVLLVYLTWAIFIAAAFLTATQSPAPAGNPGGPTPPIQTQQFTVMSMFVVPALIKLADAYTAVFAMRAIGLYYHHFKRRFAWSWG